MTAYTSVSSALLEMYCKYTHKPFSFLLLINPCTTTITIHTWEIIRIIRQLSKPAGRANVPNKGEEIEMFSYSSALT